jgi:hypothetical protein
MSYVIAGGLMERHPIPAIVLCCKTCGLVRIADDHIAAQARAAAHNHLSGHQNPEYTVVETPERLKLAQAFEQRSRKAVTGYVEDGAANTVESLVESLAGNDTAAIRALAV